MVLFGGLEIVAGGYLVHRHYKNKSKNEKKRLEEETQQRRHNTFPSTKPQPNAQYPQQQQPQQQPQQQQQQLQHFQQPQQQQGFVAIPQQKYACHAPQHQPQPLYHPQFKAYDAPPPPIQHTQSFEIPRRPVAQQQPQQPEPLPLIIQPLQRSDSMATISRMPIANGYRPSDEEEAPPNLPPRRYQSNSNLSPIPQSPYSNAGFSVSTPGLGAAPPSPIFPVGQPGGRQTVDDNWETYGQPARVNYAPSMMSTALGERVPDRPHYAPSVMSTALGENNPNDPPPPYRP